MKMFEDNNKIGMFHFQKSCQLSQKRYEYVKHTVEFRYIWTDAERTNSAPLRMQEIEFWAIFRYIWLLLTFNNRNVGG